MASIRLPSMASIWLFFYKDNMHQNTIEFDGDGDAYSLMSTTNPHI